MVASTETERRIKILDYVRENSVKGKKVNKADVMRHLEPVSRLNSTHRTIVDLIEEGKIKVIKDNPRSQTHNLAINDNNDFNKINQELLKLEKHVEELHIPKAKKPLDAPKEDLIMWDIVLKLAMIHISPFEKDNEIVNRKILKLLATLALKKVRSLKETKE